MDRSVDSIGSCSLDVDADSSDISDTSGSLNFPTPLSVKDITREFTANIRERCSLRTVQNSTALVDPVTGQVRMVLTQPTAVAVANVTPPANSSSGAANATSALPLTPADAQPDKKPSYLNLACCVNGYSNLTTYDSKIRQDINKSREVSPIRPSSSSLQYCKKNNALAPPVLHAMPNATLTNGGAMQPPHTKQPTATGHKYAETNNNYNNNANTNNSCNNTYNNHHENGNSHSFWAADCGEERGRHTSFIQQRVERLYGPGALAQGFYSPKKTRTNNTVRAATAKLEQCENPATSELSRKFQELSPSKDYSEFRKKLGSHSAPTAAFEHSQNNSIDLPVLRHLSQEFRAQLPTISPKRNFTRISPGRDANANHNCDTLDGKTQNGATAHAVGTKPPAVHLVARQLKLTDEVDHTALPVDVLQVVPIPPVTPVGGNKECAPGTAAPPQSSSNSELSHVSLAATNNGSLEKDGNYFLKLLKGEQTRLLALAGNAEKYIEALTNNPEITEDTMGFLRSASGKARLLVSQKMKQFEGLCHNNLNRSPEDKFPTTLDDLQGFWDMVYLQIDHIDSIFAEIEALRSNDWKKPIEAVPATDSTSAVCSTAAAKLTSKTQKQSKTGNAKAKAANTSNGSGGAKQPATMSAAALKREAQRKQLLEMKRKNRMAMVAGTTTAADTVADGADVSVNVANVAAELTSAANNSNSIELFAEEKRS